MSDPLETMDPNLKEVLLDIAKDERSTLFRVERRDIAVGVMDDVPSLSAGTAGWTPAERHLLQAYREEVALLLQDAFRAGLEGDAAGRRMFEFADPSQRRALADESHLPKSATRLLEHANSHDLPPDCLAALGEVEAAPGSESSSVGSLTQIAYRMVPSEIGLVLVGISHVFQNKLGPAMTLFREHLQNSARADLRRHSWSNLGKALTLRGESRKAYEAHLEARKGGRWTPIHAWNCLATALDCGDSDLIHDSLEQIAARISVDVAAMPKMRDLSTEMRAAGWSPSGGLMIPKKLLTHLSAEGRYLAHALLE